MEWKGKKLSEGASKLLEQAEDYAKRRKDGYLDTDHLLLALLAQDGKSPFAKWLEKKGIPPEAARTEIQRALEGLYHQLDGISNSYREAFRNIERELARYHSPTFAREIIKTLLEHVDRTVEKTLKGEKEREAVPLRVRRWVPAYARPRTLVEEFFGGDIFREFFGDLFEERFGTGNRWVLKEETIYVPKNLLDNLRKVLASFAIPQEESDLIISQLADIEEKLQGSMLQLYDNGVEPRRLTHALRRGILGEDAVSPRYSIPVENVLNRAAESADTTIEVSHIVDALLASPRTIGGHLLTQLISSLRGREEAPSNRLKEELREEEKTALERFTVDLTQMAKEGKLDPVIGREREIQQVIEILGRRGKNNPVLVGPAGVGKTAIVEGLAQRIVSGDVPDYLKDKKIYQLDMGGLIAGTKYRGEMEERVKELLENLKKRKDVILFIDEVHLIVGAGRAEGAPMDVSNLMKPALARGEIRVIGATTPDEYRKYIEKDPALERRFQPVWVDEPDLYTAVEILRGLRPKFEEYHKVKITDEALESAVKLTARYVQDRKLPDKAIDVLDQAAARKKIKVLYAESPERLKREIDRLRKEIETAREGKDVERQKALEKELKALEDKLQQVEAQKKGEQSLKVLQEKAKELEKKVAKAEEEGNLEEWEKLSEELKQIKRQILTLKAKEKGDGRHIVVTDEDVAEVVSEWTGIPVAKMMEEERAKLLRMEEYLHRRLIDQDEAVRAVSEAIRRARAGVSEPKRPLGSFLFLGPTGVGKTELAKTLAEFLFGDEDALIRLDMSEFKEEHSVAKLIGAPPGYVGYEEGGKLTEAVRRRPYAVILLDEIEKAHPRVFDLFLQVLDDGRLTDSQGRTVSFRNTVIIMTSNLGAEHIRELMERYQPRFQTLRMKHEALEKQLKQGLITKEKYGEEREKLLEQRKELEEEFEREFERVKHQVLETAKRYFRPEFLNRIDEMIVFRPLKWDHVLQIVDLLIKRLNERLKENKIEVELTSEARELLAAKGFDPLMGARPLRRVIQQEIENRLSELILKGEVSEGKKVQIGASGGTFTFTVVEPQKAKS